MSSTAADAKASSLRLKLIKAQEKAKKQARELAKLQALAHDRDARVLQMEPALVRAEAELNSSHARCEALEERNVDLRRNVRVLQRKCQRTRAREHALQKQIKKTEDTDMKRDRDELRKAQSEAAEALRQLDETIHFHDARDQVHRGQLEDSRKRIRALQRRCARAPQVLAKAIARAEDKSRRDTARSFQHRIRYKGVYTPEMRASIRQMVKSGCAPNRIGQVVQEIARIAGMDVKCAVSRRTIHRAILEGGVAAKVQLGHEILKAKGEHCISPSRDVEIDSQKSQRSQLARTAHHTVTGTTQHAMLHSKLHLTTP